MAEVRTSAAFARAMAGKRWFPLWGIIHHRGRKSGTAYETTIAVVPTTASDVLMIGLPFGATTNWAQNVLAAGGATVTWKGKPRPVTEPRIVTAAEAATLAKPLFRRVIARFPAALVMRLES
jgi:deazaflavin-dependent oxidoreductase (nitroreductase family)